MQIDAEQRQLSLFGKPGVPRCAAPADAVQDAGRQPPSSQLPSPPWHHEETELLIQDNVDA